MAASSAYQARPCDENGFVHYPDSDHEIWQKLFHRQAELIQQRACQEYLEGVKTLKLPVTRIPQLHELNSILLSATAWQTEAVPALISFDNFFKLLARKHFPVATFIRSASEFEYLQEPDIFHEIFGHCPLLSHPSFAHFTQTYGALGVNASKEDRVFLARLYWFTVEFGLVESAKGTRIYGGGILSSPGETLHALDNESVERRPFDILDVLRTPYRIDIMQPIYYVLESIDQLFEIADLDIKTAIKQAKQKGLFSPTFAIN